MGLLDTISDALPNFLPDDPQKREAAKMGLLNLGAAMLGANTGNFGRALGAGIGAGAQGYRTAYDDATQNQYRQAQLRLLQNQYDLQQRKFNVGAQLLGIPTIGAASSTGAPTSTNPTAPSFSPAMAAPGADNPLLTSKPMASWPTTQPSPQAAPSGGLNLQNITPTQAYGAQLIGLPDLTPTLKLIHEGYQQKAGDYYTDPVTGKITVRPILDKGQTYDVNGNVVNAPGAVNAATEMTSAVTDAQERSKGKYTFQTYTDDQGVPHTMTTSQLSDKLGGPQTGFQGQDQFRQLPPALQQRIIADAQRDGNPVAKFNYAYPNGRIVQGQVNLAAPADGITGQSEAQKQEQLGSVKLAQQPNLDYATKAAQDFAEKGKALSSQVAESQELLKRIQQSRDALARFSAGGGAETRMEIAKYAQALNMPQSVVDKIAGGDLSAVEEFQKYATQEALQTMRQSLASDTGPGSQGNRIAMQMFFKNNPNIDTDPRAIEKIFNFQTQRHNQLLSQQDDYVKWAQDPSKPKDITAFSNFVSHKAINGGDVTPKITAVPIPTRKPNMPIKGQVIGGYRYKGGDPANQASWEKQ